MSKRKIPTNAMERRTFRFQVRAAEGGADAPKKLVGHAALFGVEQEIWPDFFEVIEPGAFSKTIAEGDIRAVWNHNTDIVLGRNKNGTLKLSEDAQGLGTEITPPDTDLVRDMCISPIVRGDVDQMSFGFQIVREKWEEREDGTILFTLLEIKLFEVSPCTIPAYPDTEISARSAERIEEFKQRRQAAEVQSAPGQTAHPEQVDFNPKATPAILDHPETTSAPVEMRHLDRALMLRLEIEREEPLPMAA